MRLIPLVRTASGRLAAKIGGVRIAGASALKKLLVYDPGEEAYVPGTENSVLRIPGFFGDGRDGPVRYTEDTTLHADVRATSILIDPGVTVYQNGFEQSATGSITNYGTIHNDGPSAVAGSRGIAHSVSCTAGMTSGDGGFLGANGAATSNSLLDFFSSTKLTAEPFGAVGGDGGGPSNGPGGQNFFSGWTYDPAGPSPFSSFSPTYTAFVFYPKDSGLLGGITVGCGGGGGTPDTGGAGGAGGSIVRLRAPRVINNGLISARGGNGGDAVSGNSGGGGGGGGGRIVIVCSDFVQGTLSVVGGLDGAGIGTGDDGQPGSDGTIHIFGAV